jgi:hypothetical protein
VLVKLHENIASTHALKTPAASTGCLASGPILARGHGHFITSSDASPWLVAADVLITDHSSIGFDTCCSIAADSNPMPELIARANIG